MINGRRVKIWNGDFVDITVPKNEKNGNVLNYKNEEGSLLRKYFDILPMNDSEMVEIETWLTTDEYRRILNGSMVKFADELYYTAEINGYDPQGNNRTTLKLIRKTR